MVKRVGVLEETAIANVKKMIESHKPELQAAFEKRDPEKRGWYALGRDALCWRRATPWQFAPATRGDSKAWREGGWGRGRVLPNTDMLLG
jgi:hypothetical protein